MGLWDSFSSMFSGNGIGTDTSSNNPIGALGDISFEVAGPSDILTFDGYSRQASVKSTDHEIIGSKPLTEVTGCDLQKISFEIKVHTAWGHSPEEVLNQLIEYCEGGEVLDLILDSKPIGKHKWIIESVNETAQLFGTSGQIIYSKIQISLKEYIENEVAKVEEN